MSDRASAELFGMMFKKLASDPTDQHKSWARDLWKGRVDYDFSEYQMECDDALIVLGLAHIGSTEDCPGENVVLYDD